MEGMKEGFDRLSLALGVLAMPLTLWLILEDTNWVAPTRTQGTIYIGLSILAGLGVWLAIRGIAWVVRGFTPPRREPPA
jgi:hypothetical protein